MDNTLLAISRYLLGIWGVGSVIRKAYIRDFQLRMIFFYLTNTFTTVAGMGNMLLAITRFLLAIWRVVNIGS